MKSLTLAALSATLQRALVLAQKHDIWFEVLESTKVIVAGRRLNREEITRVSWTLEQARSAGLAGKQNWKAYPRVSNCHGFATFGRKHDEPFSLGLDRVVLVC